MNISDMDLAKRQTAHLDSVMSALLLDPAADDYIKGYDNTRGYLLELIEKNGSLLSGLISAMERYLEK